MLIDLILALQGQVRDRYGNDLANLFRIGSSVFTDSSDIKLFIPLIEQVVNNGPDKRIYNVASDVAARLPITSPNPSPKVASDAQTLSSSKAADSNYLGNDDKQEIRAPKRAKLAHGGSNSEEDCGERGERYDTGALNREEFYSEPALASSSMFRYRPLDVAR